MSEQTMTYKSRPVVRCGKTIYYGSMANEYVVMLNVQSETEENGIPTANSIKCYMMKTDKNIPPMEAITQTTERKSLYDALGLAAAWLDRVERT